MRRVPILRLTPPRGFEGRLAKSAKKSRLELLDGRSNFGLEYGIHDRQWKQLLRGEDAMCWGMRSRRRGLQTVACAGSLPALMLLIVPAARADGPVKEISPIPAARPATPPANQVAAMNRPVPAAAAPAAKAAAAADSPAALIQQLGDDRFEVREEASRRLSQMGIEIQPALDGALHNPDLEVRVRARRILDTVLKADLEKRLNAFAEDVNDAKHLDLPGWSRYRQVIGSSGTARKLFVEMQRAEPNLFRALEDGPAATATALDCSVAQSVIRMQSRARFPNGYMLPLGSITAMLFVGSDNQVLMADNTATQVAYLTNQPAIQQAVTSGSQIAVIKKILGAWIARDASANVLAQNLSIAMRFDLKEGVHTAANALKQGNQPAYIKQMALAMIGRLGDKTNLPSVEASLGDTELCGQMNMNNQLYQTQVRDVALAVAIHLEGQEPKNFGFDRLDMSNGLPYYNPGMIGFRNADERDASARKWADWVAKHHPKSAASTTAKKS